MNLLIFCSNPVNGGTARIFFESVKGLYKFLGSEDNLYPCINADNKVEIYHKIDNLIELPIISAETLYPNLYGGSLPQRVIKSIKRAYKYERIRKRNLKYICEFIVDNNIDAVIIHNGGYVGDDLCNQVLEAAYKCKKVAKKRIYILHNDMNKSLISKMRFRGYDLKISKEATEIVTVSNFTKNRIKKSSFISKEISVIYDGMDVRRVMSSEECEKIIKVDSQKHNILMIGNFMDNKGQKQFIESASYLIEKDKDYRFTIIGNVYDELYYEKCKSLIREKGLEKVFSIYTGINNASDYINMFDVQVVPSMYDESFGLISVEAMANGVPVVAFACGGIPEVVKDGRDGFVVPLGDTKMMSERIYQLVNNTNELTMMAQMCHEDYCNKFSTLAMIRQYVDLIYS